MKKVVIIGGPTGVGKSELAFRLAEELDGELISCDSVQVFRGLQIGANKTCSHSPHREHLLDLVDWTEEFSVADFYSHCTQKIDEVLERRKIPILVGGTGFYLDWILKGRPGAPPTDPQILKQVEREIETEDSSSNTQKWNMWWERLRSVDPEYAQVILPNDFYRLKRALAVHRSTGLPLSHFKRTAESVSLSKSYDFRCFFITADREYICRNIDSRCEEMLSRGLLEEVYNLKLAGFHANCQAGRSIGYFESLKFLSKLELEQNLKTLLNEGSSITEPNTTNTMEDTKGHIVQTATNTSLPSKAIVKLFIEFLDEFKSATRQYSRKQENWFASKSEFKWIRREEPFEAIDPKTSLLFSTVRRAILASRQEYDNPTGWLADEDSLARQLVTDRVRKRMKVYKSSATRFHGKVLEDFIINIRKFVGPLAK